MILYNSDYFGLLQLTTVSGSAVYRSILPSLFSTCVLLIYKYTWGHGEPAMDIEPGIEEAAYTIHPFVITIYIMAFSLIINHRLNYCYQRYWESCSNIYMMTSKWMDSATTLASFHYQSKVYEEDRPRSFGDQDKPLDLLDEKDKYKAAPTGGNTRTAMINFGGVDSVDKFMNDHEPNNQDRNHNDDNGFASNNTATSSSGSSDSDSSSDHILHTQAATPAESSSRSISRNSFVSIGSRERHRQYSDADNFSRARRQFSSKTFSRNVRGSKRKTNTRQSTLQQIFAWKSAKKIRHESNAEDSDSNELESKESNESLILGTNSPGNAQNGEDSSTPTRQNLSTSVLETPRQGLLRKISSMPIVKALEREKSSTSRIGHPKSITGHGINKAQSDRQRGNSSKASAEENQGRHRRMPSTDIPASGPGGIIVKSFKPNPSLDWQKQNLTAIPRNTGLHPTAFHVPFESDFEELLLEEEKERKGEARKKQLEDKGALPGEEFLVKARHRPSLPSIKNLRKPSIRSFSDSTQSAFKGRDSYQISSVRSKPIKFIDDGNDIGGTERRRNPRLELFDLPSLYKKQTVDNPDISLGYDTSSKKPEVESSSRSSPFLRGNTTNNLGNERSFLRRSQAQKMNGRASLFLQEAAHLYSLMSAIAMASLRADMEGVSSPLVDYVPGQKFPPVNPEEIQVKILVSNTSKRSNDSGDKRNSQNDEIGNQSQICSFRFNSDNVRIKRNNKYSNILMFLFGMSRNSRQRTIYNASRPFSVLGGISDAEVETLRKVRGPSAQHALCCLWLREFITREHLHGSTGNVAPPIVARVYQHISDGTQQYNNCRKTTFTQFPFPHAQLTSFFGFVSIFIFPLLYYTYVNSIHVALTLNFLTVSCFIGIQEVALELEEPFIRYPNDLPLNNYQAQFNEALISSLYGGFHPDAWGDAMDNGGIFGTRIDDDDSQLQNPSPILSNLRSSSYSERNNSVSTDVEDRIESRGSSNASGRNASTNTDDKFKSSSDSNSSLGSMITKNIPRTSSSSNAGSHNISTNTNDNSKNNNDSGSSLGSMITKKNPKTSSSSNADSHNMSTNTNDHSKNNNDSSSSLGSMITTNNPRTSSQNSLLHFTIPEGTDI